MKIFIALSHLSRASQEATSHDSLEGVSQPLFTPPSDDTDHVKTGTDTCSITATRSYLVYTENIVTWFERKKG